MSVGPDLHSAASIWTRHIAHFEASDHLHLEHGVVMGFVPNIAREFAALRNGRA